MMNFIRLQVLLARTFGFNEVHQEVALRDLEIVSLETDDPAKMLKEFATSNHPRAVRFREYVNKTYGIDFSGPPPPLNEWIVDWRM